MVFAKSLGIRRKEVDPNEGIVDLSDVKKIRRPKQNVGSMGGRMKAKKRELFKETMSIISGKGTNTPEP